MEEKLMALENEIVTIKRIVNGFIQQNPALEGLEVEGISFKSRGQQLITANVTPIVNDAMVEKDAEVGAHANSCKICFNAVGEPYMYCFPGPCPQL